MGSVEKPRERVVVGGRRSGLGQWRKGGRMSGFAGEAFRGFGGELAGGRIGAAQQRCDSLIDRPGQSKPQLGWPGVDGEIGCHAAEVALELCEILGARWRGGLEPCRDRRLLVGIEPVEADQLGLEGVELLGLEFAVEPGRVEQRQHRGQPLGFEDRFQWILHGNLLSVSLSRI